MYLKESLFEHRFWLQVLGDHARFILDTLSPSEIEYIQRASYFIRIFDDLLMKSRGELNERELIDLTIKAQREAEDIRELKLDIIREYIVGDISIQLPPTFINHMVNEAEEYLRVVQWIRSSKVTTEHALHNHNLWLPDASGHANGIFTNLDSIETDYREKSYKFFKVFEKLSIKSFEFSGYLRTDVNSFPALDRFNALVEKEIKSFMELLLEVEKYYRNHKIMGTMAPLMADHMYREECYYLIKLSKVSEIRRPDCDPTKPRKDS